LFAHGLVGSAPRAPRRVRLERDRTGVVFRSAKTGQTNRHFAIDKQRLATRGQYTEVWNCAKQSLGKHGSGIKNVLAIVEQRARAMTRDNPTNLRLPPRSRPKTTTLDPLPTERRYQGAGA